MPSLQARLISAAFALFASTALIPEQLAAPPAPPSPPASLPGPAPVPPGTPPPAAEPEEIPAVRRPTPWRSPTEHPVARIAEAEAAKLATVKALFAAADVTYPPAQVLLRGFKKERRLELWAAARADAPLRHVTTYEICSASGVLGPKRREGDMQVPEGFYTLSDHNPASHFHLAMLVSYPNLSDRILGDARHPGGEIMIHGRCASVGCLAMSDERIQEIWLVASALRYAGGAVQVHLFPARDMDALLANGELAEHHAFWKNLKEGLDLFQARRRIPAVRVDTAGRYRFL